MTLDATHRSRHGDNHRHLSNSDEAWKDWTSTWRKIGTNGHIQPVTMTGTIKRGEARNTDKRNTSHHYVCVKNHHYFYR